MSSTGDDAPPLRDTITILNDGGRIRVLHVDDEPDFCDIVALYLEREGDSLEVVTEQSAETGLERLEADPIDCVVSDYDMPGTNGLEFLGAVRERHPDLPFILFTGKGSEEIASEAISAGVTDYLQKGSGTEQYSVLANRIENTTRRRHAEREIRRGFRAIETAREGISFLDEYGRFIYVNGAYADVYGYDRDELIGEYWAVLYPEEDVDRVSEEILPSVPEEGRWTGESVHVRKDGTRLVVDHALAYTDEGTLLCLVRDVTEELETERALDRERERFELFVEAVEEYAIFTLDTEGFVTSWNRGAERIKGYAREEILGEHFSAFYPEERAEAGVPEALLEEALAEGAVEDRGWRVRRDGSEFWANVVITAVFDDGQHRGFVKVTRDESDRHRSTEQERAAERALEALVDSFYVLDTEGGIVRATDRTTTATGYAREELRATSLPALFDPDDRPRVTESIEGAIADGQARTEATLRTAGGRTVPYELRMARLSDGADEPSVACIGRDVSDWERWRRRIDRQLTQFEHLGGVISHDLRTPLGTARGRIHLARETGEETHLRAAESSLDRLEELVDDLADVMRRGTLVREPEAVGIEDCLRPVWGTLESDEATLDVEADGVVRADREALKRLFENLLKNALEHGGPDVTVSVGTLPDGFYVEDDGPGIAEDERDTVFDLGYTTKESGSGFGLASVRQLVVAHGWEIAATEGSEGGARFEITDVEVIG